MILEFFRLFVSFARDFFMAIELLFRQFVSIEILGYAPLWLVVCIYVALMLISTLIFGIVDEAMED